MSRRALTSILVLFALLIAGAIVIDRRADLREAAAEARFGSQGQIVTVEGREMHVDVRGEGPDLVLIHGAGGSSRDMTMALGERLSERYRVFAVDRPGFGWSERAEPGYSGIFADGVETPSEQARLLSIAVRQLGAMNPIVLGHSYGGAVAMAWALDQPASAIVIVSGATMPWPGDIDISYRVLASFPGAAIIAPTLAAFLPKSYIEGTLANVFAPQSPPEDYFVRAAVPLAVRTETLRANARQVHSLRPEIVKMSDRYASITLPVEVLHGTADKTVYREVHAEPLTEVLPNAALTILAGTGHMPHHVATNDVIAAVDRAAVRAGLR